MFTYIYIYIHICLSVCLSVYVCVCGWVCVRVCVCVSHPCKKGLSNPTVNCRGHGGQILAMPTKLWMLTGWVHRHVSLYLQMRLAWAIAIRSLQSRAFTVSACI